MLVRNDIQILRGIAVLLVVLYHLKVIGIENGFLGVDIFFVISGFLMAKLYDKGSALEFYKRRLDRLLPAYATVVILSCAVGLFLLTPVEFRQLFEQSLAATLFTNNVQFWLQDNYFSLSAFNPLLNLWSLSLEVQFYLIVPFIYPIIRRSKLAFGVLFFGSLVACFLLLMLSPKTAFFMMPFRIWEFLVGAWVAWNFVYPGPGKQVRWMPRAVPLLLLSIAVLALPLEPNSQSVQYGHPGVVALLVVVLTGWVLAVGMPQSFEVSMAGRSLRHLGDLSYSIYLVHFPLIVFWNYVAFSGTNLSFNSLFDLAGILGLTYLFAHVLYNSVETKWAGGFRTPARRLALVVSILPLAVTASFFNEQRFSAQLQQVFAAVNDTAPFRCGKLYPYLNADKLTCTLGEEALPKRVLLVGNSHADAIKESYSKIANANGYSVDFLVSNQPLLHSGSDVETVIKYATDHNISTLAVHFNAQVFSEHGFRINLKRLVESAGKNGITVQLFEPVPAYEKSVPETIYEAIESGQSAEALLHEQKAFDISVFGMVSQLRDAGVRTYRTKDLLCPTGDACLFQNAQSKPLYYDAHHLNLTGAKILEPMFQMAFDDLIVQQLGMQSYQH